MSSPLGLAKASVRVGAGFYPCRSACESGWVVALKCSGKCSLPWCLPGHCTGARGPWLTCPGRPAECGLRPGAARVLGGADAPRGRWPWQVSVQHGSQHRCGGSVLAPDWIVTAAHCVHSYRRRREASNWLVFAGVVTHGAAGQEAGMAVEKIIYHSLYDDKTLDYDIALMKLQAPLNFSGEWPWARSTDLLQGSYCWVSGWGYTSPQQGKLWCPPQITETLKEALVPLIGTTLCNSSCMYAGELTARMLCAGYPHGQIDACQGDSGGPLVCQDGPTWRLVGIVSWGQGCGEPNHPGVYTNVAQLLELHAACAFSAACAVHFRLPRTRSIAPQMASVKGTTNTHPGNSPRSQYLNLKPVLNLFIRGNCLCESKVPGLRGPAGVGALPSNALPR
uniref:Transmembrane serine protease 5 n=1 Tax=Nothoprocta perdicaria TaxID=30464 RepID=A0A8C6YQE9_NOTPE